MKDIRLHFFPTVMKGLSGGNLVLYGISRIFHKLVITRSFKDPCQYVCTLLQKLLVLNVRYTAPIHTVGPVSCALPPTTVRDYFLAVGTTAGHRFADQSLATGGLSCPPNPIPVSSASATDLEVQKVVGTSPYPEEETDPPMGTAAASR